jgi:hypothetical protein
MARSLRTVFAAVAVFAFCLHANAADDAAKAKKANKKGTVGVIKSVDKETITIKLAADKKKGSGSGSGSASDSSSGSGSASAAAEDEKTFKINDGTSVSLVSKGEEPKDAKVDDLKAGQRVRIMVDDGVAKKIEILGEAKKKKNETE